jgi:predicted GNAT superfamily acetyltransferase
VKNLRPAEFQLAGNTYILNFGEGKDRLTAVWRLGGAESVEIPCPSGPYRLIDRDGESRIVEAKGSSLEVLASEMPSYIVRA